MSKAALGNVTESSPSINSPQVPYQDTLANEKMYSIQIGDKLFRLSGASLSSDSPSYFTTFFSTPGNEGKVIFIDRSPVVFEKIYLHLQGYYINVDNEYEFVYLFADAHYFNLPGLKEILYKSDIFTRVGNKSFRISKELITSEGNFPNYFSVSFNALFRDPHAVQALRHFLRPPQQKPPILSNHSPELFEELLGFLQGKSIAITSEDHRRDLLSECKYYKFLLLEQKLLNHKILENPYSHEEEIILDYRDLKKKGFVPLRADQGEYCLKYSRPYVDVGISRNLIMQIETPECSLIINRKTGTTTLDFIRGIAKKLFKLLSTVSSDVIYHEQAALLPMILDASKCHCVINGHEMMSNWIENIVARDQPEEIVAFKVLKAQYRVFFRGEKPWFQGLLLEAVSDETSFNKRVGFI